jgi:hypothetical protein
MKQRGSREMKTRILNAMPILICLIFVLLFFSVNICISAEKIVLKNPLRIIPIHGEPFEVQTVITGSTKAIQYTTTSGEEGFIDETNIKNLNEFKFLLRAAKSNLDDTKTAKSGELGREVDRLGVDIREREKELSETLSKMRSQSKQ